MKIYQDKTYYVYGLEDPTTDEIRYVGISMHPEKRLYEHASQVNHKKAHWIAELRQRGMKPKLVILDSCAGWDDARIKESHYFNKYKNLLNSPAHVHGGIKRETPEIDPEKCKAVMVRHRQCHRTPIKNGLCWQHSKK